MISYHQPVLPREVVELLTDRGTRGGHFVDATLGGGGHAELLLECRPDITVTGIDQDPEAVASASVRLARFGGRFRPVSSNFRDLSACWGREPVLGVLMDLGVSSHQLETASRGFSFQADGPLDMRMDPAGPRTAADLVNGLPERELADLIWELGEERASRRIARALAERRRTHPFRTTGDLAQAVAHAAGRRGRIHPATRTFQALRMAVNDELGALSAGLDAAWAGLAPGGRLAVISFHSLEDRMVKRRFLLWAKERGEGVLILKKPLQAQEQEQRENPRSRSAKLRVLEKK